MRLRDLGEPFLAGLVAVSPMADMAVSGPTVDATAGIDPLCIRVFLTQMASNYLQAAIPGAAGLTSSR